jgi:hypothetical protein
MALNAPPGLRHPPTRAAPISTMAASVAIGAPANHVVGVGRLPRNVHAGRANGHGRHGKADDAGRPFRQQATDRQGGHVTLQGEAGNPRGMAGQQVGRRAEHPAERRHRSDDAILDGEA